MHVVGALYVLLRKVIMIADFGTYVVFIRILREIRDGAEVSLHLLLWRQNQIVIFVLVKRALFFQFERVLLPLN